MEYKVMKRIQICSTVFVMMVLLVGGAVRETAGIERNTRITAGTTHTCALLQDGMVKCWGANSYGQLGYGDKINRSTPPSQTIDLGQRRTAIQIATGDFHTCAVLDNLRVKCWGRGGSGRLGIREARSLDAPSETAVRLGFTDRVSRVAAGGSHTCVLLMSGTVKCWGAGGQGQLGYGNNLTYTAPPASEIDVFGGGQVTAQIAVAGTHTCALSDAGGVKCWGGNAVGQLGYGDMLNRSAPPFDRVHIGRVEAATQIAAGSFHSCVITTSNGVKCWGSNKSGQLGYDQVGFATRPPVDNMYINDIPLSHITAGGMHTCVLISGGNMYCWGAGSSGQLGYGEREDLYRASQTAILFTVSFTSATEIAAGEVHSCALFPLDNIRCWGDGSKGQLGYGNNNPLLTPDRPIQIR